MLEKSRALSPRPIVAVSVWVTALAFACSGTITDASEQSRQFTIRSGENLVLDGSSLLGDTAGVSYLWAQLDGPVVPIEAPTASRITLTAPPVDAATLIIIKLTVTSPQSSVLVLYTITVLPAETPCGDCAGLTCGAPDGCGGTCGRADDPGCGGDPDGCGTTGDACHAAGLGTSAYCSAACPCGWGEGDCDTDAECQGDLVCISNVGADFGYAASKDVCAQPGYPGGQTCGGGGGGCGDGICDGSEDCASCPADCSCGPACGDGICDGGEDCASCPADCSCAPVCGDGICAPGEVCDPDCVDPCSDPSACPVRAFPGAEGFGADTPGGRGGRVLEVTNLDDSGSGSLRAALTASGPRIVVFRVAGTIELLTRIEVDNPFLTVAGQTAPGDGITIKNHPSNGKGSLRISTHDVILRYLRIRASPSPADGGTLDALNMYPGPYNIIVDHCSFSWATDEVFQTGGAHDFTVQWSIIAEGLNNASHPEGAHSKGMHFRDSDSDRISVHHNLLAHNYDRNPNINTTGVVDLVNNVFYNASRWTEVKDKFGEPTVNIVNNFYKLGPSSQSGAYEVFYYESAGRSPQVYVAGNIGFHRPSDDLANELIVREDSRWMVTGERFTAPPVTTVPAVDAYELVLANVGATLPVRDAHDARIVRDVRNGTGAYIDHPSEVGGWLPMAGGTAPADTDHDGMPDMWEAMHGFDPSNPSDGPGDADGDGYTNVEEYLNATAP